MDVTVVHGWDVASLTSGQGFSVAPWTKGQLWRKSTGRSASTPTSCSSAP